MIFQMLKFLRNILLLCYLSLASTSVLLAQDTSDNQLKNFLALDSLSRISLEENRIDDYLNIYFKMLDLADEIKDYPEVTLRFHKNRGSFFQSIGLYKEALRNNKRALQELKRLDKEALQKNYALTTKLLGQNASNYKQMGYIDSSYQQFKMAIDFVRSDENYWPLSRPSAINNMGHYFQHTAVMPDSALYYYKMSDSIIRKDFSEKSLLLGSVRDNIATLYVDQMKYKEAKALFAKNFGFYNIDSIPDGMREFERWTRAGSQWAEMEIKLNNLPKAKLILDSVQQILQKNQIYFNKQAKARYLQALNQYFVGTKNYEAAFRTINASHKLSDSILSNKVATTRKWSERINHIAFDHSQRNYLIQRLEEKENRKVERIQFWIAIGVLLLGLLLLFLFYKQNLKDIKQKKLISDQDLRLKKLENEILHQNIELKKRDLSDFALSYVQDIEWASVLSEKLHHFKKSRGNNRTLALKDLEKEIGNKIKLKENNPELYKKVDLLSNEFYSTLNNECPTLTKSEIRLCALLRLKLDSSHIAQLLNISQSSLHQARYRLRKKLNLAPDRNLDDYCCEL